MRISDWSSDVCSSDLPVRRTINMADNHAIAVEVIRKQPLHADDQRLVFGNSKTIVRQRCRDRAHTHADAAVIKTVAAIRNGVTDVRCDIVATDRRSEEPTSDLQSLMRNSYDGLCLYTKIITHINTTSYQI